MGEETEKIRAVTRRTHIPRCAMNPEHEGECKRLHPDEERELQNLDDQGREQQGPNWYAEGGVVPPHVSSVQPWRVLQGPTSNQPWENVYRMGHDGDLERVGQIRFGPHGFVHAVYDAVPLVGTQALHAIRGGTQREFLSDFGEDDPMQNDSLLHVVANRVPAEPSLVESVRSYLAALIVLLVGFGLGVIVAELLW